MPCCGHGCHVVSCPVGSSIEDRLAQSVDEVAALADQLAVSHRETTEARAETAVSRRETAAAREETTAALTHATHLESALRSAREIGMAMGILMARRGAPEAAAFEALAHASQQQNRKLRDVAADVVMTGDL